LEDILNIQEYQNNIIDCKKCSDNEQLKYINGFEKPCNWLGKSEIKIIVLGHSPYVRSRTKAEYVLNMDKPKRNLHKYIVNEILNPLGVNVDNIYCTNLLKCLTFKPPEDIKPKTVFLGMLDNCKELFESEVAIIKPKIIIGLSECILKFISKNYYREELSMKNSFGMLFSININGIYYDFIPVVHLPIKNSRTDKYYFPSQTDRLNKIKDIIKYKICKTKPAHNKSVCASGT
jgi:uracil-DNA glycosylase family 4